MKTVNNIFEHTDCISEEMLTKYISNKLSPGEKHEVEKHLIDCEMCSDAVEGLQMMASPQPSPKEREQTARKAIDELNVRIRERGTKKKEVKIIFLREYRTPLAVAASIALIFGLVWFFKSNMSMKELDQTSSDKIFAEKFEPYPPKEEVNKNESVDEVTTLGQSDKNNLLGRKDKPEQLKNIVEEDKKVDANDMQFAAQLSKEAPKGEEVHGNISAEANRESQTATPLPDVPKTDVTVRDESLALGQVNKPEEKTREVNAPSVSISAGASANTKSASGKDKANENYAMKEEVEKEQKNTEVIAYEKRAESGKDRSRSKKSGETKALQPEAAVTESNAETLSMDSLAAGLIAGSDDADLAMKKYEQKNYPGAAEDFEKILAKDPNNYNALFYSAVSYLSTGQPDKAITNLNKVLEKKDGELYDSAQWYLSLAYIKKSDTQNARKNLTELQKNSKSKYQKQADATLREMQK